MTRDSRSGTGTSSRRRQARARPLACMLLGCGFVAACVPTRAPDLGRSVPDQWVVRVEGEGDAAAGADADPRWWRAFRDATLDAYVESALADSLDVQAARLRLTAARARERASDAMRFAAIDATVTPTSTPDARATYYVAGATAAWEAGAFGRTRARDAVARADTADATASVRRVKIELAAAIVRAYWDATAAEAAANGEHRLIDALRRRVRVLRVRLDLGRVTAAMLDDARREVADARSAFVAARAHRDAARARLALLAPDRIGLPLSAEPPSSPSHVSLMAPAAVVRSRPDVAAAEAAVLRAAGERLEARAALYPRLALSGTLGIAVPVNGASTAASFGGALGPVLEVPLFDWGRRRALFDASDASLSAVEAEYRVTVRNALAAVESALAATRATHAARRAAEASLAAAARALVAVEERHRGGRADGLDLAAAEAEVARRRVLAVTARHDEASALVDLYEAQGGALPELAP